MFVNKIGEISRSIAFRSYQHKTNSVGENIMHFNYPYDYENETCEIQFFQVTPTEKYNYKINEAPIASVQLKPEGVDVNLQDITTLDGDETFAYKIVRKDKKSGNVIWEGADTGVKTKLGKDGEYVFRVSDGRAWKNESKVDINYSYETNEYNDLVSNYKYTLVSRKGTTPTVQGAMYMAIADSYKPGVKYDPITGKITYDRQAQINAEKTPRTFSNKYGGTFAAFIEAIPELKQRYKYLITPPIANGDDVSHHGYWNKNNKQIASTQGDTELFGRLMRELYKNGMGYVYDGTFTSEGLEGIHFQYALRWANKNPQSYYWFRMSGINDGPLGLGVVPENKENFRVRFINTPYNYEQKDDGTIIKKANPDYDSTKESYIETYDAKKEVNELSVNSHDDTNMVYRFPLNDTNIRELDKNIESINNLNKKYGKNIKLDSAEASIMLSEFSNFKLDKKTEGGFVTWDANTDMAKMNYHVSGYDEKNLMAISDRTQRFHEQQMIIRGAKEVQDMAIQAGQYWTGKVKDIQTIYTAQTLSRAKTVDEINKLIDEGKLPKEARIDEETLSNILNGQYLLSPKGILDKESITVKSLMKLPLDTLEFGENTVGVLATSYFTNLATTDDTIGMSRFDLLKQNNPHLVSEYANVYNKVNQLFQNELKDFAEAVIKKANETSNEKLIDSNGDYTEYGEYVMELMGQDIAKYALLKSLSGESFKPSTLENGELHYNYAEIKEATTLKALGINAHNPEEEALILEEKMEKGLKALNRDDVSYVADSVSKRIAGTDTISFRLAEALYGIAGLGLAWRLDAAKDVIDMDAVRNKETDFDDAWNDVIKFWSKFVQTVKEQNPHANLIAEVTDVTQLMQDTYGKESNPYDGNTDLGRRFNGEPDAMAKFFNETGITSEAGYSYFFTNLLNVFSGDFETGGGESATKDSFKNRLDLLLQTRSADYLRNLYTFMGNHDKPRMIHGLALDMKLFHSPVLMNYPDGKADFSRAHNHREDIIRILSGARTMKDVPIELRLNVDNNDYFRTVSARAVAQSKLLMDTLFELEGKIPAQDVELIKNALIDLTNGNYLSADKTEDMTRINIKELSSLENAFEEILRLSEKHGLNISESEKQKLMEKVLNEANSKDLSNYLVHGDFDWAGENEEIGRQNRAYLAEIMGVTANSSSYNIYTVQLARLLKDSLGVSEFYSKKHAIAEGFKEFVTKYDKKTVDSARKESKKSESSVVAMKKNGYAARDVKTAIEMAIKQAEYRSGKTIQNKEDIIGAMYKSATEPAVAKASMIMEFLKGLPGMPTMYGGDEMGMTGYEEKAKNVYLQNRNALPWEELKEDNIVGRYRRAIMNSMNNAIDGRNDKELSSLNNGTPYAMDVMVHAKTRDEARARIAEISERLKGMDENLSTAKALRAEQRELVKDLAKIAYLMQSSNGDMTVTLFNAGEVEQGNRVDYFAKYGLDTEEKRKKFFEENNIESINPENKYIPIQPKSELDAILLGTGIAVPVGTIFMNSNMKDKTEYVVKEIGGKLGIVRKDGGKIIMDGKTAKNGVMILKYLKKIAFRGKKPYYNKQYNIVSNPYAVSEKFEEGKKLSIISK